MSAPHLFDPRTGAPIVPSAATQRMATLRPSVSPGMKRLTQSFNPAARLARDLALAAMAPEMSKAVFRSISNRLASFSPKINLVDHVESNLKVSSILGEGLEFKPVDWNVLLDSLQVARTRDGERAFADKETDFDNPFLQASLMATKGYGVREIRGAIPPPRSAIAVPDLSRDFDEGPWRSFSANFGSNFQVDLLSLHFGISPDLCSVHVDTTGFLLRGGNGTFSLTADALQHTVNELVWKTFVKAMLPQRLKFVTDRVSLVLPNSANGYARSGPRIRQVGQVLGAVAGKARPVLNAVTGAIPGGRTAVGAVGSVLSGIGEVGGVVEELTGLKNLRLPGVSIDILQRKHYNLQVNLTCGDQDCSGTVSSAGTF